MCADYTNPATILLHTGHHGDPTTGSVAVPIHQTTSFQFKNTEHAENLFALKELGNIYTRIMNPTNDVLEKAYNDVTTQKRQPAASEVIKNNSKKSLCSLYALVFKSWAGWFLGITLDYDK